MAAEPYSDLYFTPEQLFLSREETLEVAGDFFGTGSLSAGEITDADRAFIQRALLIAVDKSEKAGFLFDLYSAAVSAGVKRSVQSLVKGLAKKTAKRWFSKYIDDTPKISPVGKASIQYSGMGTDWRTRVGTGDTGMLTNYLTAH